MTREDIAKEIGGSLEEIAAIAKYGLRTPELEALFVTADELQPKVLVEVGACNGLSSIVLAAVARKHSGHLFSVEYKEQPDWRSNLERYGVSEYATLIAAQTPWLSWETIPFKRINYLLIDGDHHFFPVACDIHAFAPFVPRGGRMAFHDYSKSMSRSGVRVVVDMLEELFPFERAALVVGARSPGLIVLEKLTNKPTRS